MKDSIKLFGISIMACCAVTVCNMFLNYYVDLTAITHLIDDPRVQVMYDAQIMTVKVVCAVTGGCLALTTVVMLLFYIKHYIDSHAKEIGILKALGYSDMKIAKGFAVFGLSVWAGCAIGYLLSFILMPLYYDMQNEDGILPHISIGIHWSLAVLLVLVPTLVFAVIAVGYSLIRLNQPCVHLLKGIVRTKGSHKNTKTNKSFIEEMRYSVLHSRKILVFFIIFSAFCFSAMLQMSSSMRELSSPMMGLMMLVIGMVLAFTTLYIAITTVIRSNRKNIAMMRVFGYDGNDCKHCVLDGYRPFAYVGFALGSVYQYLLLTIMVNIVFAGVEGTPAYQFDLPLFFITLMVFAVTYEGIMLLYGRTMKQLALKQIMEE
ncbi:MAG: FtsX-like permease family protein [Eubacteriales bacterium]|nr:FtsX-like permease family protein [Eubacteriales bacterium]